MENELAQAYSEVYEILKYIPMSYLNKIPKDVLNIFKTKRDKNYKVKINPRLPLEDQKLQRKTLLLLAVLNLDYWCKPEEREEILNIYWKNEKEKEPYVVIDEQNNLVPNSSNTGLMVFKQENLIEKIWTKLKKIFKKGKMRTNNEANRL